MFNPTQLVIDTFVDMLKQNYVRTYGLLEPEYANIIGFSGRIALENIANSDASYHDVDHTVLVTEVGQEILKGKQLSEGGVSPADWMHFVIGLLTHDIGYVRGVCRGDGNGRYVVDMDGSTTVLPIGATDAALTPYHVARGKLFVRERFGRVPILDIATLEANIEFTKFPVPEGEPIGNSKTFPGLLRAADLIGQLADISYLRKAAALWNEFRETGMNEKLGYHTPADLRKGYPGFFWHMVNPYIQDALRYLQVTQAGKHWIAALYANIFAVEHNAVSLGPELGPPELRK